MRCPKHKVSILTLCKFWVSKRYKIITGCEDAPNFQVSLKNLYAHVNVDCGAERGGAEVNPESQQQL